jgi:DNA-binding response OmpR family regulator
VLNIQEFKNMSLGGPAGVVALVDDDRQITQVLQSWLDMLDMPAEVHESAEKLLSSLEPDNGRWLFRRGHYAGRPLVGAVIDLNLPGLHGFGLAKALRKVSQQLPIVVITAARNEVRQALGDDVDDVVCLSKPFKLEALEKIFLGE